MIAAYTNALVETFPQKRYAVMDACVRARVAAAALLPEVVFDKLCVPQVKKL